MFLFIQLPRVARNVPASPQILVLMAEVDGGVSVLRLHGLGLPRAGGREALQAPPAFSLVV